MNVIGDVEGKVAVLFDDIIDTARSLVEGAKALIKAGAVKIIAAATHGILSDGATERIMNSPIEKLYITDTIYHNKRPEKFEVLSVYKLLGETIMRIRKNLSVSVLFR